jgi:hypothetical protein
MKVIILQHLSGAISCAPKDEIDVPDDEALRLIDKGIAKAKNKQSYTALVTRITKEADEEAEKQVKLLAVAKEDEIKAEVADLLSALLEKVQILSSTDEKYRDAFLAEFHEAFVDDEQNNEGDLSVLKVDNSGPTKNKDETPTSTALGEGK